LEDNTTVFLRYLRYALIDFHQVSVTSALDKLRRFAG